MNTINPRKLYLRNYQREWIKARRSQWIADNGPCVLCGSKEKLEIDHKDPKSKSRNVSEMWSWNEKKRLPELLKCQVLCYVCHKAKHASEHGTFQMYQVYKCKCDACRAWHAEKIRKYRAKKKVDDPMYRRTYRPS